MTDYKLVPVEPTPEMLDAAVQDGICVDGKPVWKRDVEFQAKWKYQQMLAAAPAQQVDPVSAQVRYRRPEKGLLDWSVWQSAPIMLNRPYGEIDSRGWEVEYRLLYTTPQPAPDVTQLVEALEACAAALAWNCFGECRAIHAGPIMPADRALQMARDVLVSYHSACVTK